ncbi:MAG: ABC transporter ATP-binding protein [Desulfobacteraceae bacterium]|nr:ABC transporter ATP-binding protein [Desulfobacteraceae bacterium]MBC2755315.1 ABC transporter ATP-binding protein [Desulfobacteraceae bacterium]
MVNRLEKHNNQIHSKTGNQEKDPGPLMSLRGINKSYQNNGAKIEVLRDLSVDIYSGERIAIVGESGIGKSTLLHILGTLDRPDSGTLLYKKADVFEFDKKKLADFRNKNMGFVFQFHYLLAEFSALENILMPGLIRGLKSKDIRERAEAILVRVGLKERMKHRVRELSGGEQQRVALARALVLNPAILLADEPTGNLDKKNSNQVHDLLFELNDEYNMTIITVTHNMRLAEYMNKQMTLVEGKLVEIE